MDRQTFDEIKSILSQIEEFRKRLDQLLSENGLPGMTGSVEGTLDQIREESAKKAAEEFQAALARINFEDKDYRLLRVIDGDTLEVRPPQELTRWMRDVHIRLYGVDAPESNAELGPVYTEILEKLCRIDEGRLHILWERERQGTEYAGFPTTSFERGIANVFVHIGEEKLLYLNAVLASLPDVEIERGTKRLIRAARHVRDWPRPFWHHWHRHWPFHSFPPWHPYPARDFLEFLSGCDMEELRSELQRLGQHHPWFMWVLPKDILPPRGEWPTGLHRVILDFAEKCGCPICRELTHNLCEEYPRLFEHENITPVDLLLLLAYSWGHLSKEGEIEE